VACAKTAGWIDVLLGAKTPPRDHKERGVSYGDPRPHGEWDGFDAAFVKLLWPVVKFYEDRRTHEHSDTNKQHLLIYSWKYK